MCGITPSSEVCFEQQMYLLFICLFVCLFLVVVVDVHAGLPLVVKPIHIIAPSCGGKGQIHSMSDQKEADWVWVELDSDHWDWEICRDHLCVIHVFP